MHDYDDDDSTAYDDDDSTAYDDDRFGDDRPQQPPQRISLLLWLLGGAGAVGMLCCGGLVAGLLYLGAYAPETSVYVGNQTPNRFLDTAKSVGALDDDEKVLYFYSDALTDIREGFYFVSDKKVAVYSQSAGQSPLTVIAFDDIVDLELFRVEGFFQDSQITIYFGDDEVISFPVSSEFNRDQSFFDAIERQVPERAQDEDSAEGEQTTDQPQDEEPTAEESPDEETPEESQDADVTEPTQVDAAPAEDATPADDSQSP